jgi:sulfhydrogenase subunit alpha
MNNRSFKVDFLARVEGEGGLYVRLRGDAVLDVRLNIFEPPRFFEAFLRGRSFREAPDITARICGICPIAYQMSAVHAMEEACGVKVNGPLRALRRLTYCGEWIESHTLHVYMLHAPDFLGYPDAISMAKDHPEIVQRSLRLKKAGNAIIRFLGGREIHPVNICVGGFYKTPAKSDFAALAEELKWAREAARQTVLWAGKLPFPDFEQDYCVRGLAAPGRVPVQRGATGFKPGTRYQRERLR